MRLSCPAVLCFAVAALPSWAAAQTAPPRGRPAPPAPAPASVAAPAPSQATAFKCPRAGTVIETTTAAQITEFTSQGADPSEPTLCRSKRGFSNGEAYYGRYGTGTSPEGLALLRQGLADLFAGRKEQFTARFHSPTVGGGRAEYEDTWRRLGPETITIAGKPRAAMAFQRAQRNLDATFQGTEKLWYDPASGVWIKRMALTGGETSRVWSVNWEVSRIVEPAS